MMEQQEENVCATLQITFLSVVVPFIISIVVGMIAFYAIPTIGFLKSALSLVFAIGAFMVCWIILDSQGKLMQRGKNNENS